MKKKVVSSTIALLLAGAMALPVHAEEKTTQVSYTAGNTYTINIPATLELEPGVEKTLNIGMDSINVEPTKKVDVKVKSGITNGNVTLDRANSSDITTSTVSLTSNGQGITNNEVVATFQDQATTPIQGGKLYFSGLDSNLNAGTWTGSIVFEVDIVNR
ncbi:hypothetical protein KSU88_06685 [[Clostridium] innocuum]|uniref:hypothetical protein n=1 Tax=Bacillota TaxID=1239 RepID=UPI00189E4FE3|nr:MULTISPECIES: hypothetical protein [Coprobacillaceae]MBV3116681.1 hypothetical protein [[Clostridium] innocuum]MCR0301828.1 hypothetical protein [[Clostridium] innocuum]